MKSPGNPAITLRNALVLAGALLLCQNQAFAKCVDDWLGIQEIRDGDNVELRATNYQEYPITYSVRVKAGDAANQRPKRYIETLHGQESQSIVVLPREEFDISCSWVIGSTDVSHDEEHLYLLPYASGASYRVLQGFGSRFSHRGVEQYAVDFKMQVGTPVHAARGGVVARLVESNDKGCWEDGCGKFANFIVILHDDGTTGEYYHLQQDGALVDVGERVVAGQLIGLSGNTGHTALPHLHFAVYRATNRARSQSIPISFLSADGIVYKPRRGHHYLAVAEQHTAGS